MKKIVYGLLLIFTFVSPLIAVRVLAQTVGTIGVGDISYLAKAAENLPSKEHIIRTINSRLNGELIKTRKFEVLNYAQLSKRISRQGLNLNDYYSKKYSGTEYLQAGLDYILTVDVTKVSSITQKRGESQGNVGSVELDFKLIGVADITNDLVSGVSAQVAMPVSATGAADNDGLIDSTVRKAVDQLVDQVISNLFPIRVVKIADNGEVTLNYGEGLLKAGDTVLLYEKDAEVAVNKAGQVVGDAIATLQIVTSETKFANAKALNGFQAIKKGQRGQLVLTGG